MAGRYATALFELALESGKIREVEKNMADFAAMLKGSEDLDRLVRSPVFSAEDQQLGLSALLKKAGIRGLTANFLALVAQNRRLFAVSDMIQAFRALLARHRGEVSAEVSSAARLSAAQVKSLKAELKAAIGQNIQISTQVDPALLGGLVVKVGSRMIDTSLRTRLNNLKFAMKEVG